MIIDSPIILPMYAYILGSVPTAYIVVKLVTGQDIRVMGTGNVGALNTYHQVGIWYAILVLLTDVMKGVLAVLIPTWADSSQWTVFATSTLALVGHNWPVFLGFRGGKGAAAIFGISFMIAPVITLLVILAVATTLMIVRNVVLSVGFGFVIWNLILLVTGDDLHQKGLCVFLTLVVTATYLVSMKDHLIRSIKDRDWKGMFTGLE